MCIRDRCRSRRHLLDDRRLARRHRSEVEFLCVMTRGLLSRVTDRTERGKDFATDIGCEVTPWTEPTPSRQVDERRWRPPHRVEALPLVIVEASHRTEETPGVRMLRVVV